MKSRFDNKGVPNTDFTTPAITNIENLNKFVEYITTPNWIDSTFFGDYSKWVGNILYFPFDLAGTIDENYVAKLSTKTTAVIIKKLKDDIIQGYYMGGINTEGILSDGFLSYEPYTTCRVWLPFHSFIELPMKVFSTYKSIYFILKIDFITGRASYYIYGCKIELPYSYTNGTIKYASSLSNSSINNNSTIITQVDFTLAYEIPIGTTGASDRLRNMTLRTVELVGDIASAIATQGVTAPSSAVKTVKRINPKTNRLRTVSSKTTTYTPIDTTKRDVINSAFNWSTDVIKYANLSPRIRISDNPNLEHILPTSIYFVFEKVDTITKTGEFKHLFGLPLAEVSYIGTMRGFTDISEIQLENNKFSSVTDTELSMIEDTLLNGVLCFDNYNNSNFSVYYEYDRETYTENTDEPFGVSFADISGNNNITIYQDNVLYKGTFLYLNGVLVKPEDIVLPIEYETQ